MRPQPLIAVSDVEASSRWYQRLLGCESAHGGQEYERLVQGGVLILQLHRFGVEHHHGPIGDPNDRPLGNGVLLWFRSIGELGSHLAGIPGLIMAILGQDAFDINPADGGGLSRPEYDSPAAMVAALDKNGGAARAAIESATDEQLMSMWTLRNGRHEVFTMPKIAALRLSVVEHMVHHGGQMTVYLRLLEVPVPQVFGPTADFPNAG